MVMEGDKVAPLEGRTADARLDALATEFKKLAAALRKAKGREQKRLHDLGKQAGSVFELVKQLEASWNEASEREKEHQKKGWMELDAKFSEECAAMSWRKDGTWPKFFIEYGVLVEFDEKTRSARVGQSKVADCDLDSTMEALRALIPGLHKDCSSGEFLEQLQQAYVAARGSAAQVPVFDVYKQVVIALQKPGFWRNVEPSKFKSLTVEQFRARLCKCIESNTLKSRAGMELRMYPPLDAKDGLFLFNPAERRAAFVGRIEFARAGDA
ncbi:MAG: hypothetical protein KJ007_10225 [Burkholderiales bacterium]|nr:hypothetical protein [Burkholderiales bacterium]